MLYSAGPERSTRLLSAGTRLVAQHHAGFGFGPCVSIHLGSCSAVQHRVNRRHMFPPQRPHVSGTGEHETVCTYSHTTPLHAQAELAAFGARLARLTKRRHAWGRGPVATTSSVQAPRPPWAGPSTLQEPEAVLQGLGWLSPRALPRRAQSFENNQSRSPRTRGRFRLNQVHRHSLTCSLKPLKPTPSLCQPPVDSRAGRYGTRFNSSQATLSIRSHRGRSTLECPLQYAPRPKGAPSSHAPHTGAASIACSLLSRGPFSPFALVQRVSPFGRVGAGLTGHGKYRSIYLPVCTTFPSP